MFFVSFFACTIFFILLCSFHSFASIIHCTVNTVLGFVMNHVNDKRKHTLVDYRRQSLRPPLIIEHIGSDFSTIFASSDQQLSSRL